MTSSHSSKDLIRPVSGGESERGTVRREVNGRRAQAIYGHVVEDDGTKHTPSILSVEARIKSRQSSTWPWGGFNLFLDID